MEEETDDMEDILRQIQSSSRLILERVNQILPSPDSKNITCACKYDLGKCTNELKRMDHKIDQLDRTVEETDNRMKTIEQRLESLETSLMTVQTDDSKLRRSEGRKNSKESDAGLAIVKPGLQSVSCSTTNNAKHSEATESVHIRGKSLEVKVSFEAQDDASLKEHAAGADDSEGVKSKESVFVRKKNEKNKDSRSAKPQGPAYVEVLEQADEKRYEDENYWRYLAHLEVENGKETLRDLEGVHTVICLDISASMRRGTAWTEAKTFVVDYLNGLDEVATRYGMSEEHVALVTFGHETKVQRRLTNKYNELRDVTDHLRLGGPSPLYGGMCLALAAAASSEHQVHKVNQLHVFTRMIIITDGHLTDQRMFAGPDNLATDIDKAKAKVVESAEEYKSDLLDMYIVPVGQSDTEFLQLISNVGEGTILDPKGGRQMSRRTYLTSKMGDLLGILPLLQDSSSFSEEDKKTMEDIRQKAQKGLLRPMLKMQQDKYKEINNGAFPPIGSRVRRGPDWMWNEQDSHGPGTVIGHDEDDQVWVEWDANEHQNIYRYGRPCYDVLIVDEPRVLKTGQQIAVGCVVKPGKDLRELRPTEKGVVIKLDKREQKARIRWSNGKRTDCSYGVPAKEEIVVCSGFQPFEGEGCALGSTVAPKTEPYVVKQSKNKNKNPD